MPSFIYWKGYTKADYLSEFTFLKRWLFLMPITLVISILYQSLGKDVLHIYVCNFDWVFPAINITFMIGYSLFLALLYKSPSYIHVLTVVAIFVPMEMWIKTHIIDQGYMPPYSYLAGHFLDGLPYVPHSIALSIFDGLQGIFIIFIGRIIAQYLIFKSKITPVASQEQYDELFKKEWTEDSVTVPSRDFSYWVLRSVGVAYFAYFALCAIALIGPTSFNDIPSLGSLITMTFQNPALGLNTFCKLTIMFSLLFIGAYNKNLRYHTTLLAIIGHAVSATVSIIFYFSFPTTDYRSMLLASTIVDSTFVILFLIVLNKSKADSIQFKPIPDFPDFYSAADQISRILFIVLTGFYSILFLAVLYFRLFFHSETALGGLAGIFYYPDPQLSNTLTLFGTLIGLNYLLIKGERLRDYLVPVQLAVLAYNIVGCFALLFGKIEVATSMTTFISNNLYFVLTLLLALLMFVSLSLLRKLAYNMDLSITCLSPSTARNIYSLALSFFSVNTIEAKQVMRDLDTHIAQLKGRKRGILNIPFWILEHILPWVYGLRPLFSLMDAEQGRYYLKKYILRQKRDRDTSVFPEIAEQTYKVVGFAAFAMSAYANYSSKNQGAEIGFVPAEARDRLQSDNPLAPPPFKMTAPLPLNNTDPNNFIKNNPKPIPPLYAPRIGTVMAERPIPDEVDYLILGSGAGGASMAYELAKQVSNPERILVVERGARYSPIQDFNDHEMEMLRKLFKEGGLQQTQKMDLMILQAETMGGTTVVNNAVCFTMPDEIKKNWKDKYGLDLNGLDEAYKTVQADLDIQILGKDALNQSVQDVYLKGVTGYNASDWTGVDDKLSPKDNPTDSTQVYVNRNLSTGRGLDNIGNKYMRKRSMLETYIPWAEARGVQFVSNTSAVQFLCKDSKTKASHVILRTGEAELKTVKVNKAIICSGGVIASSHFLMRSGVENVGQKVSCNFAFPLTFKFPEQLKAFDGVQITLGVSDKLKRSMFETYFNPPGTFSVSIPFFFDSHRNTMLDYSNLLNLGSLIGSEANGHIAKKADLLNGQAIEWELGETDYANIKFALTSLLKIGYFAGAEYGVVPLAPGLKIKLDKPSIDAFSKAISNYPLQMSDLALTTAHPQGGNGMAIDNSKEYHVTNQDGKVVGFENVFVADASLFPTSITVNPQWTIMALSHMLSKKIAQL